MRFNKQVMPPDVNQRLKRNRRRQHRPHFSPGGRIMITISFLLAFYCFAVFSFKYVMAIVHSIEAWNWPLIRFEGTKAFTIWGLVTVIDFVFGHIIKHGYRTYKREKHE